MHFATFMLLPIVALVLLCAYLYASRSDANQFNELINRQTETILDQQSVLKAIVVECHGDLLTVLRKQEDAGGHRSYGKRS